ncbi:MAG: hypothetical protein LKF31_08985 [Muribaculaceae bacterium]|nr:hypothetical protein [Muribaculaceae bacterium]
MKKAFLKIMLLGALAFTTPMTFTSCSKDYDDDISALQKQDSQFNDQLSALQTALTAAQSQADAAKSSAAEAIAAAKTAQQTGDDAAKAAAEAKAEAELAKQAAAEAKTEAINAAIAEVQKLMADVASKTDVNNLSDRVTELGSKIDGIQSSLNMMSSSVDELVKYEAAVKVQIDALQKFQALATTQLSDIGANIGNILSSVTALTDELSTIKAQIVTLQESSSTNASDIKAVKDLLEGVTSKIDKLSKDVDTLIGALLSRLSSVTFVPQAYVGGIPCIDFASAQYTPVKFSNGKLVGNGDDVTVTDGKTEAHYRLNPAGITIADIDKPSFMCTTATSRASSVENSPVKVNSFAIDNNGELIVYAGKTTTASLNISESKINIVALKVPISERGRLSGEKASDAVVYSEYVRVAESTFKPEIGSVATPVNHWSDSTTVYNSAYDMSIDVPVNYKEGYDLSNIVAGCKFLDGKHNSMPLEGPDGLKAYGLTLRYRVAAAPYVKTNDNTNQQAFAKVSPTGFVISRLPNLDNPNEAAVDKQPIIAVSLVDTVNNKLVDQRYLKVKFTKGTLNPVDLGEICAWTKTLSCDDIVLNFTWDQMTNIYSKLNLSKADFANIYTEMTFSGTGSVKCNINNTTGANTNPLVWTLTAADLGKILPETTKDFTVTVKFHDPKNLHGDVSMTFKVTINIILPSLYGYYDQYWQTKYSVYRVMPVQYNTPGAAATCTYNNNLWNAFTQTNNTLVKYDASNAACGAWDMQFALNDQLSGFKPGYTGSEPNMNANDDGYKLYKNGAAIPAATLNWATGHVAWLGLPTGGTNITLDKNNGGKDLVGKEIKIGIWAEINPYNYYKVTDYNLLIVPPITVNTSLTNAEFYDGVISGSVVSCATAFTMTDFRGYIVAKQNPGSSEKEKYASVLYKYYEVQDPEWDLANARIGMKNVNGSLVVDDNLSADQCISLSKAYAGASITKNGDDLIFKNNSGSNVEQACNIFIRTTVTYGWGTSQQWVKIRLNPAK